MRALDQDRGAHLIEALRVFAGLAVRRGYFGMREVREMLDGRSVRTSYRWLQALESSGLVEKHATGRYSWIGPRMVGETLSEGDTLVDRVERASADLSRLAKRLRAAA